MTLLQHFRATLALGLPLIGGQLAQTAIGLTDTVMMGWYGVPELAAVALGASFFHLVLILGMGFALAVMPMVATAQAKLARFCGVKWSSRCPAARVNAWNSGPSDSPTVLF